MISKIIIQNFRVFERFELDFTPGLNVLVGGNDVGKSTLLDAVRLALTGRLADRWLESVLSPYLVNQQATDRYVAEVRAGRDPPLPEIIVDLFLETTEDTAALQGTNNLAMEDAAGLRVRASFDPRFAEEYQEFIQDRDAVSLTPTEYYRVDWLGFSGNPVTRRGVPVTVSRIDASAIRLRSGADYYLQQIIGDHLDAKERVELSRAYRSLREGFAANPAIAGINAALAQTQGDIADGDLSLSIDISERMAWESNLVPHLDDLPFQFIGNGSQSTLKILLALKRTAADSHVVLIEEPENHLSGASLAGLVRKIVDGAEDQQLLVATHSSYVLNKLGLDRLVLLGGQSSARLTNLPPDTLDYFKKLSGYDTLRVVLAKRVVLVEGPSDELLIQRAYADLHEGRLPYEDGIDVVNVRGLSHKRFLDIAKPLGVRVSVVTDNDGKTPAEIETSYEGYTADGNVTVHTGEKDDGRTLEPQVVSASGLATLNQIFGKSFEDEEALLDWMKANKTNWALKVLEADEAITMPQYLVDALA